MVLKDEHKIAKKDMDHVLKGKSKDFDKVYNELDIHMRGEEVVVYTIFKEVEKLKPKIIEAFEEHKHAKMILEELKTMDMDNEEFKPKLKVLSEMVKHHVDEEEQDLFPDARKDFDKQKLQIIADDYIRFKEEELQNS